MDIYIGTARRDLPSGFAKDEVVLVQAHEPKGGDLIDFEWFVEDWPSLDEADTFYAPLSDDVSMIARHEIVDGVLREKTANHARLATAQARMQTLQDARVNAGHGPDPKLQAVIDSIQSQLQPGMITKLLRLLGIR